MQFSEVVTKCVSLMKYNDIDIILFDCNSDLLDLFYTAEDRFYQKGHFKATAIFS